MTPRIPFELDTLAVNDAGHLNCQRDAVADAGAEQGQRHGKLKNLFRRDARRFTER